MRFFHFITSSLHLSITFVLFLSHFLILSLFAVEANAETVVLAGTMHAEMRMEFVQTFDTSPGTTGLRVTMPRFPSVTSRSTAQHILEYQVGLSIPPDRRDSTQDRLGNTFEEILWSKPKGTIVITTRFVARNSLDLAGWQSVAEYPVRGVPQDVQMFLEATPYVQKEDPMVARKATELVQGSRSQRETVARILNFVADHLQYRLEPGRHDAVFALEKGIANCTGYTHLSMALLRAVGIPTRAVTGVTLAKPWPVPTGRGNLIQNSGQGRHAWFEVWYPDLGWLPYDAQVTHIFVSAYHIRQTVGRDVFETTKWYNYAGAQPRAAERFSPDFMDERVSFRPLGTEPAPRRYILAAEVRFVAGQETPPPPPPVVKPLPPPPSALPSRDELTEAVEFGNLDFPAALRIFRPVQPAQPGQMNEVHWTMLPETAEYATGTVELAQAFSLEKPTGLADVSLALQKFGGTMGELWLELYQDVGRVPGGSLIAESRRIPVAAVIPYGGYRWVVFDFDRGAGGPILPPGRYWVILRHTGNAIFNWYFSPGTAYGDPDDSRARSRGRAGWDDILNYRFNFRVSGLVKL
jgi:transglutaminase-like putative cysteine protease